MPVTAAEVASDIAVVADEELPLAEGDAVFTGLERLEPAERLPILQGAVAGLRPAGR